MMSSPVRQDPATMVAEVVRISIGTWSQIATLRVFAVAFVVER